MLNQRQELLDNGIGDGGALRVTRHVGCKGDALVLPQAFVAGEEKSLVFEEWAADVGAEIIAFERRLGRRRQGKEVCGVERVIAEEFENLAVKAVGSTARRDIDDSAGVTPVFGAEGGIVDLEFLHGVDRGLEGDLIL